MKRKVQKLLIAVALTVAASYPVLVGAQQTYVHQVIILNEGQYDYVNQLQITPVTIGAYDPATGNYFVFDTIVNARWGSDVIIDDNNIYVAADTLLLVYDKNTLQQVNSKVIQGIRKLAIWNDQILVTRGDVVSFNSYFQVYDKNTLNLVYELDNLNGPAYASDGIVVLNDTAYIAINNGFDFDVNNFVGLLGIIDLNSQSYKAEIDLGPDGINPDNIMIDGTDIYTLNNKDFSGTSITSYDANTRNSVTVNLSVQSSCSSSALAANYIYYRAYYSDTNYTPNSNIARFDVNGQTTVDTVASIVNVYGMVTDPVNNVLYITSTDYWSFGKAYIMEYNGTLVDSFDVGISPGNLALDIRSSTSINERLPVNRLSVYPNPTNSVLTIEFFGDGKTDWIALNDIIGREVYRERIESAFTTVTIALDKLPAGVYFLSVHKGNTQTTRKIIKY